MARKINISREALRSLVEEVLREEWQSYDSDMAYLSDLTGEEEDDAFLDSVAAYDMRPDGRGHTNHTYPDEKEADMRDDWEQQHKRDKRDWKRVGRNFGELDRLHCEDDVACDYLKHTEDDERPYFYAEPKVQSFIMKAVREALEQNVNSSSYNDQSKYGLRNPFTRNSAVNSYKYAHGYPDAQIARDDQDAMYKREKRNMGRSDKRWNKSADSRSFHRKGSLNRAFDESTVRDAVKTVLKETFYPEEGEDLDYAYGAIFKFSVQQYFDKEDLPDDKVNELMSLRDVNVDDASHYTNVLIRKVDVKDDGLGGYDVDIIAAITSPDMPISEIENETEEIVHLWAEETIGKRIAVIRIEDERVVFDRREKYKE